MDEAEQRSLIMDFERNRQMLGNINAQKQQLGMQIEIINMSLEELKETKEKTVWKAVGNILIPKETNVMVTELKEKKESFELRMKTVEKQEETIMKKLNSIKSKIEGPKAEDEKAESKSSKEDKADDKSAKKSRK